MALLTEKRKAFLIGAGITIVVVYAANKFGLFKLLDSAVGAIEGAVRRSGILPERRDGSAQG